MECLLEEKLEEIKQEDILEENSEGLRILVSRVGVLDIKRFIEVAMGLPSFYK